MDRKNVAKRLGVAAALVLVMVLQSTNAFARDTDRGRGMDRGRAMERGRQREVIMVGHQRYSYHDGRFYRPSLFGFEIALGIPPLGAVVRFLSYGHRSFVIGGVTYYHYNNIYYRACPGGYMVVPLRSLCGR